LVREGDLQLKQPLKRRQESLPLESLPLKERALKQLQEKLLPEKLLQESLPEERALKRRLKELLPGSFQPAGLMSTCSRT
jgi:hypothetical protein